MIRKLISPDDTQQSPETRWLSIRDIANDLAISVHTAYKWSARGQPWFPKAIRLRNGDLRVRRDWYDQWLRRLEVTEGRNCDVPA